MAAHLHRYAAELISLEETVTEIIRQHKSIFGNAEVMPPYLFDKVQRGLSQVSSQIRPVKFYELELEKKIQNILALVRISFLFFF
jgi:hypothetical protein